MQPRYSLFMAALAATAPLVGAQAVSFSDTEFIDAEWDISILITGPDGGGATGAHFPVGGNPGAFRRVSHTLNANPSANNVAHAFHRKIGAVFDPSAFGEITSIDYSQDYICLSSTGGFCRTIAVGIVQSGELYIGPRTTVFANDPWRNVTLTGLHAPDFARIDPVTATVHPLQNPDFSATATRIGFGFVVSGSQLAPGSQSDTISGYDNWSVDAKICPGPTASSEVFRNGVPVNPATFLPGVTTKPIVGSTWDPVIDHTTFFTSAILDFVFVSPSPPINVPSPNGTLLCNIPPPSLLFFSPAGLPFQIAIPDNCVLLGVAACAQGGSLAPGVGLALTNGLDLVFGTF